MYLMNIDSKIFNKILSLIPETYKKDYLGIAGYHDVKT